MLKTARKSVIRVGCLPMMNEHTLFGHAVVDSDVTAKWQDGAVARAMQQGATLVLENSGLLDPINRLQLMNVSHQGMLTLPLFAPKSISAQPGFEIVFA